MMILFKFDIWTEELLEDYKDYLIPIILKPKNQY